MKTKLMNNIVLRTLKCIKLAYKLLKDKEYLEAANKNELELNKKPTRTDVINYLLTIAKNETNYLEIGVRDPNDNFNHIVADHKYSVDPGYEFGQNPVDFQLTSDEFFNKVDSDQILNKNIKFDVIFIDGLHLAEQVNRDVINSLRYIKDDGFIVLHDCNPPTEWHARENYYFFNSPAKCFWNGTTWKAFLKYRFDNSLYSCCIDTDWGVGILSPKHQIGNAIKVDNVFFEYEVFNKNRVKFLNLLEFNAFKDKIKASIKS